MKVIKNLDPYDMRLKLKKQFFFVDLWIPLLAWLPD